MCQNYQIGEERGVFRSRSNNKAQEAPYVQSILCSYSIRADTEMKRTKPKGLLDGRNGPQAVSLANWLASPVGINPNGEAKQNAVLQR